MCRLSTFLLGLVLVYEALIVWHQPMRSPLSEDELRAAFGDQYPQMRESNDSHAQAFLDFFLTDDGKSFFMVNLNALPEPTAETEKAGRRYGLYMISHFL